MSLGGIGTCGDTKYQNFSSFFEERNISRKGKVFGKLVWFAVKVYFFRIESIFREPFPKKTNQYS